MAVRAWVFTLNNWTEEEYAAIRAWTVSKAVVGKETGEEGTPHLQGFVRFKRTYRLAALKKLLPRAHWEPAKTNDAENYCMKESFEQWGESKQGHRTDIEEALSAFKEGGVKRVADEHPEAILRYGSKWLMLQQLRAEPRKEPPEVFWIWGPTGTGKTAEVVEKEADLWISTVDLNWFDGYSGQEAALIDDFRGDMCKFRFLLRLLDRYPLKVPVKGGFTEWVPKRIYITSCKSPEECYSQDVFDKDEKVEQLLRRISSVTHRSGPAHARLASLAAKPSLQ